MARSKRAIGIADLLNKKFVTLDFEGDWLASMGQPERNFKMLIHGRSGNGKTEFVVKLSKYLTNFGKVYYNSFEQGMSKSLQDAFVRNDMQEVNGKLIIGDKDTFDELNNRMGRRNSPKFCIIDSLDYMELTKAQYTQLVETHPTKSFIIISWSKGPNPHSQAGKDILYMADVKVRVHEYKAYIVSRYGGDTPFVIWKAYWEKKKREAAEAAKAKKDN